MKMLHLKRTTILFCLVFITTALYSQECAVDHEFLKGTYTGDCKKGKASGKGKAVGIDTYEGDFKSGLPDGQGTYTWKNGSTYVGKYSKGMKDGKGVMTFKRENGSDSITEGYWKKDVYLGKNEKPYVVHSKTGSVRDVDIEYTKDNARRVKVIVTNTTGGVPSVAGGHGQRFSVQNVQVLKGSYDRITQLESHLKSTETSLTDVIFPFRAKLNIGNQEIEIELYEEGSYIITVAINE